MTPEELKKLEEYLDSIDKSLVKEYIASLGIALKEIAAELANTILVSVRRRLTIIKNKISEVLTAAYARVVINSKADKIIKGTFKALVTFDLQTVLPAASITRIKDINAIMVNLGKSMKEIEIETRDANIRKIQGLAAKGIVEGKTVDEIVRELSAAQTAVNNQHVKTIVRTANTEIMNNTLLEEYDKNSMVEGYESSAIMDSRTTKRCASLNGRKFYKSNGWDRLTLNTSVYAIPRHYNCRSMWLPIIKGQP